MTCGKPLEGPGFAEMDMTWRDTLEGLRAELAEIRGERQRQAEAAEAELKRQRGELTKFAGALGVSRLLNEMNSVLLKGQGQVEILASWENGEEHEEFEDSAHFFDAKEDEEDDDFISSVLSWEEDGEREIVVEVGLGDQEPYLRVNEMDIRPEPEALERALIEAFREELEL
jgi:hypothetical protein